MLLAMRSSRPRFDPDAVAVWSSFSIPPSDSDKTNINNLVVALKEAGIWNDLDLLYVLAAADSQAARINWVNPGVKTAVAVNSPTFTAYRGFTGNGTTSYLNTNWAESVDGVNFTLNSASIWLWSRTDSQRDAVDIGHTGSPGLYIFPRLTTDKLRGIVNSASTTESSGSQVTSIGFFGMQRRGAADQRVFFNGSEVGSNAAASSSLSSTVNWMLGGNSTHFSNRQHSIAAWGASLAGKESAFYDAILTYLQAVGAA